MKKERIANDLMSDPNTIDSLKGKRVRFCWRLLVARGGRRARPAYLCRNREVCPCCSRPVAQQRKSILLRNAERFAERIDASTLAVHRFILFCDAPEYPDVAYTPAELAEYFRDCHGRLREFTFKVRDLRAKNSPAELDPNPSDNPRKFRQPLRERRKRMIGPVTYGIHVSKVRFDGHILPHLHLSLFTSGRTSKRSITTKINRYADDHGLRIRQPSTQLFGVHPRAGGRRRDQIDVAEFNTGSPGSIALTRHLVYVSRSLSSTEDADWILKRYRLMKAAGIELRSMHGSFGCSGTIKQSHRPICPRVGDKLFVYRGGEYVQIQNQTTQQLNEAVRQYMPPAEY